MRPCTYLKLLGLVSVGFLSSQSPDTQYAQRGYCSRSVWRAGLCSTQPRLMSLRVPRHTQTDLYAL